MVLRQAVAQLHLTLERLDQEVSLLLKSASAGRKKRGTYVVRGQSSRKANRPARAKQV